MLNRRIIDRTKSEKYGYYLVTEENLGWDNDIFESTYVETAKGAYVGDEKTADFLYGKMGIAPELIKPNHNTCSIGLSTDGKWYGWSHRAIAGFRVGSTVSKGDCAYSAPNKADFIQQCLDWDTEEWHTPPEVTKEDDDGVTITFYYTDEVPNKKLRGHDRLCEFPKVYGRGEWTAETMEDAKQMAIDFAEDVS